MRKVKLADVLWEAANKTLSPTYTHMADGVDAFSCNAVDLVLAWHMPEEVRTFLDALGCSGSAEQLARICGHANGSDELQGVRYLWLLLAMHCAEDENIEIEVSE